MDHRIQQTRKGQLEAQTAVSVWNAIRYLDSPTNYREYLPHAVCSASLQESEFVLLDTPRQGWGKLLKLTVIVILLCIILLLLLGA
ncbi:MAG TPA: hypothetical protein VGK22_00205 [Candidatus Angelobacter sp.]|jgi:hypothetical protein